MLHPAFLLSGIPGTKCGSWGKIEVSKSGARSTEAGVNLSG